MNRSIEPISKAVTSSGYSGVAPITTQKGGELYLYPRNEIGVVEVIFYFPFGLYHQKKTSTLSAALSLALSGTATLSSEEINEKLEFLGVQTFNQTNAFSSYCGFRCRSSKAVEAFNWILQNLNEAIIPEMELQNYIQVETASLQREMQTPRFWGNRLLVNSLYPESHKMVRFRTVETIQNLQRDELVALLHNNTNLSRSKVVMSGEIPQELIAIFDQFIEQPTHSNLDQSEIIVEKTSTVHLKHPLEHSTQASLFYGKLIKPFNEIEIHKLFLTNTLLGGFFGSRLMQEIREERGLTYGIGSYLTNGPGNLQWTISGELNSMNVDEARTAIDEILNDMATNPPKDQELERAKRYLSGQIRLGLDGPFSKSKRLLSLFDRNFSQDHILKSVETIRSTTSEEIGEIADNLLKTSSFNTVVSGDISN